MSKKSELTPEEAAQIPEYQTKYMEMATRETTQEKVEKAVHRQLNKILDNQNIKVELVDSPLAAKRKMKKIAGDNFVEYRSIWFLGYISKYEYSRDVLGCEIDADKFEELSDWALNVPYIVFNEEIAFVSKMPESISYDDQRRLHNDDGPSVRFRDGFGLYTLNGVAVDEQIVMKPETQTVEQIRKEENEEVKRLRIERFGWQQYMDGIGAKLIDERRNDIEATLEFLFVGNDGQSDLGLLVTNCPSTGKEFQLEVDPQSRTCEQAQNSISCGLAALVSHAS